MPAYAIAYLVIAVVFAALDFIWLGTVAVDFYKSNLKHLMAPKPFWAAAVIFYLMYFCGIIYFAVAPALADGNWKTALIAGAAFGFFAYATYDFTNLATLRDWPWKVTLVDIAWGTVITGLSACAGYLVASRFVAA